MRRLLIRARNGFLLAALLCVLIARVAVPAGWMPMAGAGGGVVLAPCSGMGAVDMTAPDMAGMPGMPHATPDKGDRHHPDPAGDHPCAGAGMSVALDQPALDVPKARAPRPVVIAPPALATAVGRGLAAPPPWQTGPPILV